MEVRTVAPLFLALMILTARVQGQDINNTPALGARGPTGGCYTSLGVPRRCIPEFENAAFGVRMEATNTCGDSGVTRYCIQTGTSKKSCDNCTRDQFQSYFLTDLHHEQENQTWWQSETMNEGVQYPNHVHLTLNLGKAFDITYVRLVFYSPRPESFAIFKRASQNSSWEPYQYYSASCRETYSLPDYPSAHNGDETRALCTSEYSDISPLRGGNVAFSTLEGRPSAYSFDNSTELQSWVTATDIRITLDRLNTFGDEVFGDTQVLQSYWYAIADVAVGARCKCNGHASSCYPMDFPDGSRRKVCQCEHNTAGPDCERCMDLYNDAPWGRANQHQVHECKLCNCNGYSQKCQFDQDLFDRTGHGGFCLNCSDNRDGPNCERCKQNYYQGRDNICVPCDCNPTGSRSLQCNTQGKCQCKFGVTGEKCDRCDQNYYEFTSNGCKSCGCNEAGSNKNVPYCDPQTGVCHCKEHVEGKRCRECKPGYFNLDFENEFGCTPCFCFGHSAECQSATGYSKITLESNFVRNNERWTSQDEQHKTIGLQYSAVGKTIGVSAVSNEHIYFVAPDQYLGDQRASYNHDLKFTLRIGDTMAYPSASDVILEGAGTYVSITIFGQKNENPSNKITEYTFRLHESPEYGWSPKISARAFMSILSNLTAIKIRGTYSNQGVGYLDSVKLESAARGVSGNPAMWLEHCSCPQGYVGQFCESCAPGYRHSPARGGPFKSCVPCDCHLHADICDSETGRCICRHNTAGDNCDICARGFYGNALLRTPYDCTRCPCPDNGACIQMDNGDILCTECPAGYAGFKCDLCSDGFYGNPAGDFGLVQICKPCDCNRNVDLNAVGNCNRTTGECLKCINNTDGFHCDQCLPGHYGDALAANKGDCRRCECTGAGALRSEDGIPQCSPLDGRCACAPYVTGRSCDRCDDGFFGLTADGCRACECHSEGSYNKTCNPNSGQCFCKPGVTGKKCDQCQTHQFGFSVDGCKKCMCDKIGSKGSQCDSNGQCPCFDNVEGRQCDRCKENKYDRQRGCVDCDACYNLVQDAVVEHRKTLQNLQQMLRDIEKNPTVIPDADFDYQLKKVKDEINELSEKAKEGSGSSEGGKSLGHRLKDLNTRLENIRQLLDKVNNSADNARSLSNDASKNITISNDLIESSRKELDNALEYLNTDGAIALAKAQNRSDQFGQQSSQMSAIAQESRLVTNKLEKEAENIRNIAETAYKTSSEAYQLAKDGLGQQSNISAELKVLRGEIRAAVEKLSSINSMATQSLARSLSAYEDALDLYVRVNSTLIPKIDFQKIKFDAEFLTTKAKNLQIEVDTLMASNDAMLKHLDGQVEKSKDLLGHGTEQQANLQDLLTHLDDIHSQAEQAVKQGNTTLEDAQDIFNTLKKFHDQVQISQAEAKTAINTIPDIDIQINNTQEMLFNVQADLRRAGENAKRARDIAQEAHHKYAQQASEEAHEIRKKAANTKFDAGTLHDEAGQLSGRVTETGRKIKLLERQIDDNAQSTGDAKVKVDQAKMQADEAKKAVKEALDLVLIISNELDSHHTLDDKALDTLARHLDEAKLELNNAKLGEHITRLQSTKVLHQRWLKDYQDEAKKLKAQVENVKNISDALPAGCFKQVHLEP